MADAYSIDTCRGVFVDIIHRIITPKQRAKISTVN
jgi:hypothetical protein